MIDKLIVIQHVEFEHPGSIISWLNEKGIFVDIYHMYRGTKLPSLKENQGILIMGGPMSIYEMDDYPWIKEELAFIKKAHDMNLPILGICLGSQMLAAAMGYPVIPMGYQEIGWFSLEMKESIQSAWKDTLTKFFNKLPIKNEQVLSFHWHGDQAKVPDENVLLSNDNCNYQAFHFGKNALGLQFHPEMNEEIIESLIEEFNLERISGEVVMSTDEIRGNYNLLEQGHQALEVLLEHLFS